MTPIQAARLGKDLEPYDLFWLEDCTPAENQEALRLVRQHTTTPLAIGEVFNTVWDYQTLIREQLIDYVRSAVTHTGGITALRKILDFAAQYQIKSGIHGPTDISPVGMAAALHLDLAIHNFGIQEYMPHGAADRRGVPAVVHLRGRLPAPRRPSPASASTSTTTRPRGSRTSRRTCRSTGSRTAPCTTGDRALARPCTRCGCPTRRSGRSARGACSWRSGRTTGRSPRPSSPRSRPPRQRFGGRLTTTIERPGDRRRRPRMRRGARDRRQRGAGGQRRHRCAAAGHPRTARPLPAGHAGGRRGTAAEIGRGRPIGPGMLQRRAAWWCRRRAGRRRGRPALRAARRSSAGGRQRSPAPTT